MGILEGLIYSLWRGLAIGVIISAPMGPVGILCVQRTLDKGRKAGLYTGVGAAFSDILYCLLTGFGLSFIEEFLERNSNVIQILGSVVLIGFGIYLFRSNPSRKLKKPVDHRIPAGKNILNGFLFTVSNPLIIFLIIGLFARFNFLLPEIKFYHYIIGFIAIFAGALLWWYIVTYFVDKVRAHFNLRSMWLINKIIGSIIMIFAVVGIITAISGLASASRPVTYMNSIRGFRDFHHAIDSTLIIKAGGPESVTDLVALSGAGRTEWKMRVSDIHGARGKRYELTGYDGTRTSVRYPGWAIVLKGDSEEAEIKFRTLDDSTNETYSTPCVEAIVKTGGKEIERKTLDSGFDLYDGLNAFRVIIEGNHWYLDGGNRRYEGLFSGQLAGCRIDSIGFRVLPGGMIRIENISISDIGPESVNINGANIQLPDYDANDPEDLEGEWGLYDIVSDEKMLRPGGDYILKIVKSGDDYDMIYLSGAVTESASWFPGMKKGKLTPLPFPSVYDLTWVGASGEILEGAKVQRDGEILTIQFPRHNSEVRLRRITNPRTHRLHR